MKQHWILPQVPYASYDEYRAATGENAVEEARRRSPEVVLKEIQVSGLRGRGGAGFRTGTKWASVKNHPCRTRVVVCNAAEGEPGTFKDRLLLRRNPYATLEGMLIARTWSARRRSISPSRRPSAPSARGSRRPSRR
jgi:NADH:ubiquinone oxidoreductase subunit F (NADH-binding)